MVSKQKCFIGLTVAFSVIGVGLLVSAFATEKWVSATPELHVNSTTKNGTVIFSGESAFGLFQGQQILTFYGGPRPGGLTGYTQTQYGLFSFGLWVSVIIFLSLSIVMGLVTIGFSIFNIFGRPIETITGPMGLYLWNGISVLFVAVTLALFGALYLTQLSKNFMVLDDYKIGWRSEGHTALDFSFLFVVGAGGASLANLLLLCLSGQDIRCSFLDSGEKEVDNGMILY